eukprot:13340095-Alexandrium_andersonii.AAC.1
MALTHCVPRAALIARSSRTEFWLGPRPPQAKWSPTWRSGGDFGARPLMWALRGSPSLGSPLTSRRPR